jgi:hypothetical protein
MEQAVAPPLSELQKGTVPDYKVAQVVVPPGVENPDVNHAIDADTRISAARDQNNIPALRSIASQYGKDSSEGMAADHIANVQQANTKLFNDLSAPIAKAGGLQTPEGRVELAKVAQNDSWENGKIHPNLLEALFQSAAGSKNARFLISEGVPTISMEYSKIDGTPLQVKKLESGRTTEVLNLATGQKLSPSEYASVGGGVGAITDTLAYISDKKNLENNIEEFNKSNLVNSAHAAIAPETKGLYAEKANLLASQLAGKNLTNEQRQFLAGISSNSLGYTQSVQDGKNAFDQFSKAQGKNVDHSTTLGAKAYIEKFLGKIVNIGADGKVTDSSGKTYKTDELNNLQNTYSKNNNFEQNYSRNKEDLQKSEVYKNLGYEQKNAFDRMLEIDRTIEQINDGFYKAYGRQPSFLLPVQSTGIEDNFARAMSQSMKGQFNADASIAFNQFKNEMLKNYPKGTAPRPNELEQAFMQTPVYKGLKADAINELKKIDFKSLSASSPQTGINVPQEFQGVNPQKRINETKGVATPVPTEVGRKKEGLKGLLEKHGGR